MDVILAGEKWWLSHSTQLRGTIYCILAIFILIPDGLVVRYLEGVPKYTMIFYRYTLFASMFITIFIAKEELNREKIINKIEKFGFLGLLPGLIWGISNLAITIAFQNTAIANALVINSSNPIWAALFSFLILKEHIPLRTILCSIVCLGSVIVIFYSQLGAGNSPNDTLGLIAAFIASISMGVYFVLIRYYSMKKGEDIDEMLCNIVAGLFVSFVSLCIGQEVAPITGRELLLLMFNGFFLLPVSFFLLTIGPSLISAPEVSLYTLIETVFAPVLVYMAGFEAPPFSTVYGGTALVIALAVHSVLALREEQQKQKTQPATNTTNFLSEEKSPMWKEGEDRL